MPTDTLMNRKYFLIIIISSLFVGGGFWLLLSSKEKVEILEVNFISDHPVCENGEGVPFEISIFSDIYEGKEEYMYPKLYFTRMDLGSSRERIQYTTTYSHTSKEDAISFFKNQDLNINRNMHLEKASRDTDIEKYTDNIRHFFLTDDLEKVDNVTFFKDPLKLKKYIAQNLKNGVLFNSGDKPRTINIILLKQVAIAEKVDVEVPEKLTTRQEKNKDSNIDTENQVKNQNVHYYANLKNSSADHNFITWNPALKKASSLKIDFYCSDTREQLFSDDVTGRQSYQFNYGKSKYTDANITVTLTPTFTDVVTVSGTVLKTSGAKGNGLLCK